MLKTNQIRIRDPFILAEDGWYYMYGTTDKNAWRGKPEGFNAYRSRNLNDWEGPFQVFSCEGFWATMNYWAPEVHRYNGKYYMLASFKSESRCRGTQVLVSDTPLGNFLPLTEFPVTPPDWECLDGTLWVEAGKPYMVFCHEWLQVRDGRICAVELSGDLKTAVSAPVELFKASAAPWVAGIEHEDIKSGLVTDGPFIVRGRGKLIMIWSSYGKGGKYAIGQAVSSSLLDKWTHFKQPLFDDDGGHGMIFQTFDNRTVLSIHAPNQTPNERPLFIDLTVSGDELLLKKTCI